MTRDQIKIQILNRLVDYYGCQNWWEDPNRIHDWVYMILIQQTTEKNALRALKNLEGCLSVNQLLKMDMNTLETCIRPAGFYRQKSVYIKSLMTWFYHHGSDLTFFQNCPTESLRQEILQIKGVGPETADAMLLYIFNRKVFICDQYAIRLFNRLGFGPYRTYYEMRQDFNHLVVEIPLKLCKEWHACIDVHGKFMKVHPHFDETWLLKEESTFSMGAREKDENMAERFQQKNGI